MKYAAFLIASVVSVAAAIPASAQSSDWTGLYAGGQFGAANNEITFGDATVDFDGKSYGAHLGYMYDAGRYVLGAEIDLDQTYFDEVTIASQGETSKEEADKSTDDTIIRMKLRAGYDAGKFLPYVTVGAARRGNVSQYENSNFYGAGVAFLAADNLLIGGEVLKQQLNNDFFKEIGVKATTTTMSLRASYKF
jgi:outer membrane immunogenic protein